MNRLLLAASLTTTLVVSATSHSEAIAQQFTENASYQIAAAQRVEDGASGFSIIPPVGWTKGEGTGKTIMVYLGPVQNGFRPNLNVIANEDDGTPANKIGPVIKPLFAKKFDKWKAMYEGNTIVGGESAYFLSSRFMMQGKDIQNLQYYFPGPKSGKRFYVLTFTALASNFKTMEPLFKQAAASVQTLDMD